MSKPWGKFVRLTANGHFFIALKVFFASISLIIPSYYIEQSYFSVTAVLGIVAAALSEGDDNVRQRCFCFAITLLLFSFASLGITVLFPHPLLFLPGYCLLTFGLIIFGSIGKRYVNISFASLLMTVYTVLGLSHGAPGYSYASLLLGGAVWYFTISLLLLKFTLYNPILENLAKVYFALGRYQHEKAKFFSAQNYEHKHILHELSKLNINIVNSLEACRDNLALHNQQSYAVKCFIDQYLEALELQERVTSSHFNYKALKNNLTNPLILQGFEQVITLFSAACQDYGNAILFKIPYQYDKGLTWSLNILEKELIASPLSDAISAPVALLYKNLEQMNQLLIDIDKPLKHNFPELPTRPQTSLRQRLRENLTLSSPVFRHAIRMTLGVAISYLVIQLSDLEGYWVVLTMLFVLQPSYSATRVKLGQRISGTLAGVVLGSFILYVFPAQRGQLLVISCCAFLFFYYLKSDNSKAVCAITTLILMAFNVLHQQGYEVALPRIVDTLTGCGIVLLLVKFVLPNWQYKLFPQRITAAITANQDYLHELITQYASGKDNTQDYCQARELAYVADSHLITSWKDMQMEPNRTRNKLNNVYDIARRNHAMLSALSVLGVHRQRLTDELMRTELAQVAWLINTSLEQTKRAIIHSVSIPHFCTNDIDALLSKHQNSDNIHSILLIQKLSRMAYIAEELHLMAVNIQPSH